MESKKRDINYRIGNVSRRVPLTIKTVVLTILAGIVVWLMIDNILTAKFRNIFHSRLIEDLNEHAMENRQSMDRYLMSFQELPRLIVKQEDFIDHIERQRWSEGDVVQVKHYKQFPHWLLKPSTLRVLSHPRTILLLDRFGKTREIFQLRDEQIPQSLFAPSNLIIAKSHNQALMTSLDGEPYLITSEPYNGPKGELKAVLLICSPLNTEFLQDVLRPLQRRHLVALAGSERHARVLASSDPGRLPAGTDIDSLQEHYLVTGKEFFDYGASELQVKFFSFAPVEEINSLTKAVISKERKERAVLAVSLILASTLIMYMISKRLQHISEQVSDFSQQVLGIKAWEIPKGDQIHILRERFRRLAGEVIEAREIIKKQAAEEVAKFKLISDNSTDAHFIVGRDSMFRYVNRTACSLMGYSEEELLTLGVTDVDTAYDLKKYQELFNLIQKKTVPPIETINRRKDGSIFPSEISVTGYMIGGEPYMFAALRDITDRREAEKHILYYQEQLRALMSKLAVVEEQERKRLSETLHDNISQNLAISKIKLDNMLENFPSSTKEINEVRGLVDQNIKFIRSLTFDMSPPVLYELGFAAAVEWLTEKFHEKYGLRINYINTGMFTGPSGEISVLLFKTIRELLMNVVKHSHARQARLIISGDGNIIEISVEDSGTGFDTSDLSAFLTRTESFGILSIRERIRYLKGTFEINSGPDRGTKVRMTVPMQ